MSTNNKKTAMIKASDAPKRLSQLAKTKRDSSMSPEDLAQVAGGLGFAIRPGGVSISGGGRSVNIGSRGVSVQTRSGNSFSFRTGGGGSSRMNATLPRPAFSQGASRPRNPAGAAAFNASQGVRGRKGR